MSNFVVSRLLLLAALPSLAVACDAKPADDAAATATATATVASAEPAPAPERKLAVVPDMVVDESGIAVGTERIDSGAAEGANRLSEVLERAPIQGAQPRVRTTRKANLRDVVALVTALGKRGAVGVVLSMDGARTDLPGEYTVVAEAGLGKIDDCSVVVGVLDDLSTAVWSFKGGVGRKARKGLSGPDLSVTGDNLATQLKSCASRTAFISAGAKARWEHAFHIGALVRKTDTSSAIDKLVLLSREQVAGQPVKLEK